MAKTGNGKGQSPNPRSGKGRGERNRSSSERKQIDSTPPLTLNDKDYENALEKLAETTAVRIRDFDQKALLLLEAHEKKGSVLDAIKHLEVSLDKVDRDHTSNWRAYTYTLLKKFDEKTYQEMKAGASLVRRRPRANTGDERQEKKDSFGKFPLSPSFTFNRDAEAFVPKPMVLNPDAPAFVPI